MKSVEELGLSPLPWTLGSLIIGSDGLRARSSIDADDETCVAGDALLKEEDARLMTASPNIYDKAYRVLEEFEKVVTRKPNGLTIIECECSHLECAMDELRDALAEADGGNA